MCLCILLYMQVIIFLFPYYFHLNRFFFDHMNGIFVHIRILWCKCVQHKIIIARDVFKIYSTYSVLVCICRKIERNGNYLIVDSTSL